MKLLYTTIRYHPAPGGMEEQVKAVAEGMAARGHEVTVVTSDLAQHIDFKRLDDARTEINGVKVKRCWSVHPPHTTWPVQPGMPLALLQEAPDLVHAYGFLYFPMLATWAVSRLKNWPVVFNPIVDAHAIRKHPRYAQWLGQRMIAGPVTVTDTDWAIDVLKEQGFFARRFEAVPPGVSLAEFDGVTGTFFDEVRMRGERPILFAGRVARGKGLDILIRALTQVREHHPAATLHVIGEDFGALADCRTLVAELRLERAVTFHGYVDRQQLISAYAGAELLCLPSRYEEFGMVIAEAWAAGTPVVAAASTAIPYVVDDGVNGLLFATDDIASCADRIIRLLGDTRLRNAMGAAGRKKVAERYDWPIILDRLEQIYREVVARPL